MSAKPKTGELCDSNLPVVLTVTELRELLNRVDQLETRVSDLEYDVSNLKCSCRNL